VVIMIVALLYFIPVSLTAIAVFVSLWRNP